MRFGAHAILWTLLVVCMPSASRAELVRFRMTGLIGVDDSFDLLPPDMVAGASTDIFNPPLPGATGKEFVAYLAFDTSVPDSNPDPNIGAYIHPPVDPAIGPFGLTVRIGEHTFLADTSIANNPFSLAVTLNVPSPIGAVSGIGMSIVGVIPSFDYRFTGHTIDDGIFLSLASTVLTSDELPRYLDVDQTRNNRIVISGSSSVMVGNTRPPSFNVVAFIDNIVRVPEPKSWQIILIGIVQVGFMCRFTRTRRKRNVSKPSFNRQTEEQSQK